MKIIKNILKIDRRSLLVMIIKCGIRHPQEIPFPFPEFFFPAEKAAGNPFSGRKFSTGSLSPEIFRPEIFREKTHF